MAQYWRLEPPVSTGHLIGGEKPETMKYALALLFCATASASTIPMTGSADVINASTAEFQFSGLGLSLYASTVDWSGVLAVCYTGQSCDLTQTIPVNPSSDDWSSDGTLNGISAGVLDDGTLSLVASVTLPEGWSGTITAPVTFSGYVTGYQANCDDGCSEGPEVWSIPSLGGTGTATFYGQVDPNYDVINEGVYALSGSADPEAPEPASFWLVIGGIAWIGGSRLFRSKITMAR
jgi:hypothetical protein